MIFLFQTSASIAPFSLCCLRSLSSCSFCQRLLLKRTLSSCLVGRASMVLGISGYNYIRMASLATVTMSSYGLVSGVQDQLMATSLTRPC